ncbi:polysaccharide pyruvyl transferase family protein [Pectobacterium carotovorum]|uniref:polysaccharide pyruvyl transferase family protein n=1 Tax=Pectobacterium carotovorum TaxID=554 RepID=UPI00057DB704|nr:polysaccharide pyruvyl transferase family protein [Pectobacterium carotovorum]KHT36734.1 hypothetical protein RC99_04230 [Pectobacterium carotovorum subsp. carotovorum]MBA0192249.1 polysaccharide pyruvyl transferase family protein [Pectobacterium carotovorum]MBA0199538.1 polysaccharide pyruvyl transferase family protein [Pectobacterium carotovorum]
MRTYNIVGAFDRHNYGDIIFPLIHTEFIRRNTDGNILINYFSLSDADLRDVGGVKTGTLKKLLTKELNENDRIIMCGGDILTVDWISMAGHLSNKYFFFILRQIQKILGVSLSNLLIKNLWLQKNKYPYIMSHENVKCKIYYTGVGGSGFELSDNKYIRDVPKQLVKVDSISVRENITKKYLSDAGVKCSLVPDSALIMSDYYTLNKLSETKWSDNIIHDNGFTIRDFIVFQSARFNGESRITEIVSELVKINNSTGKSILLLPIGRATGHEDHIFLEKVYKLLSIRKIPVGLQNSAHVLHIMASLANSKAYIGTSLHGAITAYSYGHKICAFSIKEVKKLKGFLEAWLTPADYCMSMDVDFSEKFIELCENSYDISDTSMLIKQKVMVTGELKKYL